MDSLLTLMLIKSTLQGTENLVFSSKVNRMQQQNCTFKYRPNLRCLNTQPTCQKRQPWPKNLLNWRTPQDRQQVLHKRNTLQRVENTKQNKSFSYLLHIFGSDLRNFFGHICCAGLDFAQQPKNIINTFFGQEKALELAIWLALPILNKRFVH